jgi:hypothetical protein
VHRRSEIAILEELTRATCQSADRCAVASRAGGESSHRRIVIEQLCEDRRLLLIDLIRCLLMRGVPVADVRRTITRLPCTAFAAADIDVIWIDVEIAERKLHRVLCAALQDPALSDAVRELLSLHYLRIKLHHDELDGLGERHTFPDAVQPLHA